MDASCGRGESALARYKSYDGRPMKLIPVDFDSQILPGTFEYTLSYWIEHEWVYPNLAKPSGSISEGSVSR